MARINLLPWRDERRRQQTQEFARQAVLGVILALVAGGYGWYHMNGLIQHQQERNAYLEQEIDKVQKKIKEIEELEETRRQLVARMDVIQRLQQRRPQIVHLFYEIAATLPNGVYLTQVTQQGDNLEVNGRAESNARVSSYMRELQASPWLKDPELQVIEAQDDEQANTFTLKLSQTTPDAEEDSDDGEQASGDA
jgi:type IV pilus assembly protein PilN